MYDEEFIEDEEIEENDEPSLYDLEKKEYYRNVLAPQLKSLNRR